MTSTRCTTTTATALALACLVLGAARPAFAEEADIKAAPRFGTWGLDLTSRDLSVHPGTDFYLYANGNWLKRVQISADKSSNDHFEQLNDLARAITRELIEDAAVGKSQDVDAARVGAAFSSFMDEARIEQLDAKPLDADLAAIRAETTKGDVAELMGMASSGAQPSLFKIEVMPDFRRADSYAVSIQPIGLGLPDRDYYLNEQLADKKEKYAIYVATILKMIGWRGDDAKAIVAFETQLAQAEWSRTEQRNLAKMYDAKTPDELAHYAPGFDFAALFKSAGLADVRRLIAATDTAFPKVAKIIDATPLQTLKAWQAFHLVNGTAQLLSKRFADVRFSFYGTELSGQPQNTPRWKRGVGFATSLVADAIGRMYATKTFPPESKAKADALVKEVIAAMQKRIAALDWMTPATKAKALDKLSKMTLKIGYPSKWRDYSTLIMKPEDAFGNWVRAIAYEWNYRRGLLGKPIDREEWVEQYPQAVNAGYNPVNNDLTFPAAILQPPFFDPNADSAVNYGAVGTVMGHEITHAFDDQGRNFAATGVLEDWWAPEDAAKFKSRADRLAAQYDRFEAVKGYFVNGQLTMGENIADLGGVLLGFDAYHASLKGKKAPVIDGLTGEQRLFLSFAQVWQAKMRDGTAIQLVKIDVHAPPHFRINGPLRNVSEWYAAFNITPEDRMYVAPDQRVHVW